MCFAAWFLFALFFGLLVGLVADMLAPTGEGATRDRVIANAEWEQRLARMSPDRVYDEATGALLDPEVRTIGSYRAGQPSGARGVDATAEPAAGIAAGGRPRSPERRLLRSRRRLRRLHASGDPRLVTQNKRRTTLTITVRITEMTIIEVIGK